MLKKWMASLRSFLGEEGKEEEPKRPPEKAQQVPENTPPAPPSSSLREESGAGKISKESLDPDALKVIHRLKKFGHEAYFVGGCVRDLLLQITPKDFDIATSAKPKEIKRLFRNCRIIGRRFKLAHIFFGKKTIDTATFRRGPRAGDEDKNQMSEKEDLLITDDNIFGTAQEDAVRRDFTINALFYDPETEKILDFVGGLEDLERRTIRTIGTPRVRFQEDPVRIIRAIKLAKRLNFSLESELQGALEQTVADLEKSTPPRLLVEILKLFDTGHASESFRMLRDLGALKYILPEVNAYLDEEAGRGEKGARAIDEFWLHLKYLDEWCRAGNKITNPVAIASLFYPMFRRELESRGEVADLGRLGQEILMPFSRRVRLPRFDSGRVHRICVAQRRFTQEPGRRFRRGRFIRQDYFAEALVFYRFQCQASGQGTKAYEEWVNRARQVYAEEISPSRSRPNRSRRHKQRQKTIRRPVDPDDPDPFARDEEKDPTFGDW